MDYDLDIIRVDETGDDSEAVDIYLLKYKTNDALGTRYVKHEWFDFKEVSSHARWSNNTLILEIMVGGGFSRPPEYKVFTLDGIEISEARSLFEEKINPLIDKYLDSRGKLGMIHVANGAMNDIERLFSKEN